jgi:hypothetical protein
MVFLYLSIPVIVKIAIANLLRTIMVYGATFLLDFPTFPIYTNMQVSDANGKTIQSPGKMDQ